jgi:hypothetical protein
MLKEMVRTTVTLTSGGRTHSAYDSNAHQRRQDASPRVEKDLVKLILMRCPRAWRRRGEPKLEDA